MKLLYIANARIPTEKAHGLQIMQMLQAFVEADLRGWQRGSTRKVDVELVVPRRFNYIKDDPFVFYNVKKNFKIKKIFSLDLLPLERVLGQASFFIQNISFTKSVAFYTLFKGPDIIFCRDLLSALILSFFKKNVCYEIHDSVPINFWTKKFLKNISKFVSTNNYKKQEIVANFKISPDRILVAPNSVEVEKFQITNPKSQIREELDLPLNTKIVLYTGHLYGWKGAKTLVEASKYLNDDILIVLVGGAKREVANFSRFLHFKISQKDRDPDIESGQFLISNSQNTKIIERRPHKEIPYWLKAADALVLPNTAQQKISKYETSPLKLFEYMASGTPIVASDLPSIREIVSDNEVCFVEPDSPTRLAEGIKKVLGNEELAKRISQNAKEKVKEYTWQKRAEKILKAIC